MSSAVSKCLDELPATTRWYRIRGRPSRKEKAAKQQYLSPHEERALAEYVRCMHRKGCSLPVKSLRSLAQTIRRQRQSTFQLSGTDDTPPPGKNWPQAFYKRHPELRARRTKAIDRNRHDQTVYGKVVEWFDIIKKELDNPEVLQENVYNMDETGVLLSVLGSLKVLVDRDDNRTARPACVKRTLITAIECVSADGRVLDPLIIWPAVTHRSTWTSHPTPGWHFACSKTGYTDNEISLYWIKNVFDPLTKARANGKPRILISDGFGTHETLEVLTYCFQNSIILCRLPAHTSHLLQPCDVGVFGPLKTAYREQVERLYRGGANTIGKQHFTQLYSKARQIAMTPRNIRSSWSKAGLFPFNPERVLASMIKPMQCPQSTFPAHPPQTSPLFGPHLRTPTNFSNFDQLRTKVEGSLALSIADDVSRLGLQKLWHAAENAYADRAILFDENHLLCTQNNEKVVRDTTRATVVGRAKVMSYEDIIEAQRKRSGKKGSKSAQSSLFVAPTAQMLSRSEEAWLQARREMEEMEYSQYCNVFPVTG